MQTFAPGHEKRANRIYVVFSEVVRVGNVLCGPGQKHEGAWLAKPVAKRMQLANKGKPGQPPKAMPEPSAPLPAPAQEDESSSSQDESDAEKA